MQEQVGVEMTESEARSELLDMAHGKTGAVSPEVLVDQVMAVTADGDWPVQREAMRAVLRRCAFAKRDGLRVTARPPGGRPLGVYRTAREGKSTRPYRTLIAGVQPIGASCDCPDFLRNSLGLCKHALVVLNDLYGRPRLLRRATELQGTGALFAQPTVLWDPIRPLSGAGDWLERDLRSPGSAERRERDRASGGRAPPLCGRIRRRGRAAPHTRGRSGFAPAHGRGAAGSDPRAQRLPAARHRAVRARLSSKPSASGCGSSPFTASSRERSNAPSRR